MNSGKYILVIFEIRNLKLEKFIVSDICPFLKKFYI